MILVDTSVWINHLRSNDQNLVHLLNKNQVLCHPFVRGELALGNFKQHKTILTALDNLPQAVVAFTDEVHYFIEEHALFGAGIGLIDVHLIVSAKLADHTQILTYDKRLMSVATRFNLCAPTN
ncbi:MAG: type II toxin-antitoxin system VapC family toxin [Nitrosomonas sp.]|nr:type II toxin-antitoxin system VapC family toxin [Nitrosomonas sp.]